MLLPNDVFKNDTFHYTIANKFHNINYIEFYRGQSTILDRNSTKSIIYYIDEVSPDYRELENLLNYLFYTDCPITDTDINYAADVHCNIIHQYFDHPCFRIPEDAYYALSGMDWPTYNEYIQNQWQLTTCQNIVTEIQQHESTFSDQYRNDIIKSLNNISQDVLNKEKFINSIDSANSVVIVANKIIYEFFIRRGFNCICLDVFHDVIGDFLTVNKLLDNAFERNSVDYNYFLFNQRFDPYRENLIKTLDNYDLLKYGLVTQNALPYGSKHLRKKYNYVSYNNDLSVFTTTLFSQWKNTNVTNNIHYSNNVKNLFYINNNVNCNIGLIAETSITAWFCSEKSFQPLFCKMIPLIIGYTGINTFLSNEGFDMFTDIVDYQFDQINNQEEKLNTAIKNNKEILTNFNIDYKIADRLAFNRNHLLTSWVNAKVDNIVNQIKEYLE